MAYPTVDAPYGLKPMNRLDGLPYAGAIRQIPILTTHTTAIYFGDAVKLDTTGYAIVDTGTTGATPCGVFVGCSYTDPNIGFVTRQYLPAATVASDIMAFVVDDPNAVFKIAVVSGTTVIAGVGRTVVGSNMALVQNAGSTFTGNSKVAALSSSAAVTATLPLRVIDVVQETKTASDTYVELLVKINTHQYNSTTGLA